MSKKVESYNVRLIKMNGKFVFDPNCFAYRCAKRGEHGGEWVDASNSDRRAIAKLINRD